jgi:branched-chain amino acid transport system substrate-binding protein
MWSRRIARIVLARIVPAIAIAACAAGSAGAQDAVKIGMVMPLTGTLATAGKQVVAGARLYMQQHGDTVAGRKIELMVKDDTSSFEVGKRLIQELIVNDKVDVIGGGTTGDLLASAQLITEARKPTVIMLSSTSALIDKSPYFVRTSCTLAQSSGIIADWAVKNGMRKVVTLVTDFSPGQEAEATFKERYLAAGGQIAESIRVPLQNPDFAPFLQRVRDAAPQAVFVFIPSVQAATFAKQFVERGLDIAGIKLIGPGDLADDELLPATGDAMLGAVTAHFYSAAHPSPMNKAFVEAFIRQNGYRPNFMVVSGYDGMHLIYEALKASNGATEGKALVSAMKGKAWESPRGPMSVDRESGEVTHNIYIRKVEKVGGEPYSVEFATFEGVRDLRAAVR